MVKYIKGVDDVIEAPWSLTIEFLDKHKLDYIIRDDIPYVSAG